MSHSKQPHPAVRNLLILVLASVFTTGPAPSIGLANIRLFDFIFIVFVTAFLINLTRTSTIRIPRISVLLAIPALYFILEFLLPVLGLVVYGHPLGYFIGDIRWLQIYILGAAVLILYNGRSERLLVTDFTVAMKLALSLNMLVFLLQIAHLSGADTSQFLDLYYYNRPQYGDYGYYSAAGRFAAANATPSRLAATALTGIVVFGHQFLSNRRGFTFLVVSIFLLIASGSRTGFVAATAVSALLVAANLMTASLHITRRQIASTSVAAPLSLGVAYLLDIGGIATSDRYSELISVLRGSGSLLEISGRGERWDAAFTAMDGSYSFLVGTLSNPAWVFNYLDPIDSYFVIVFLQGGPVFFGLFVATLIILGLFAVRGIIVEKPLAVLAGGFLIIVILIGSMQNFLTGIAGKTLLVMAFCFVLSSSTPE